MTEEQKEKPRGAFATVWPYVCAAALAGALCYLLYASGKFSVEGCGAIILAVATLFGIGKFGGGNGAVAAGGAILIASAMLLGGCAAYCDGLAQVDDALSQAEDSLTEEPEEGSVAAKLRAVLASARQVVLTGLHICEGHLSLVSVDGPAVPGDKPLDEPSD